jgi:hypothetical protein
MPASATITAVAIAHGWTIVPALRPGSVLTFERGASRVLVSFDPATGRPVSSTTDAVVRALSATRAA